MNKAFLTITLACGLFTCAASAQSRFVTIFPTNVLSEASLILNTNETGRIVDGWLDAKNGFTVYKSGKLLWNQSNAGTDVSTNLRPVTIAGPATFNLTSGISYYRSYCTIEVIRDSTSFPPDKTLILPEGTVGIVHLESSTNLVQWQDEWVHTFANTNQNRFFRIRAERSLP